MALTGRLGARASRLTWRLSEGIPLDARSLALSRIGFGALLLLDLRERVALLSRFYTDAGFVPRAEARRLWAAVLPHALPPWSLHFFSGSSAFQAVLLALQGAAGVALVVGYRSRIAALSAYVLLLSLCQRDVLVTGGDEWMLAAFLFWMPFVPLDGAFSIESRLHEPRVLPRPRTVSSLGTLAFTAQLVMILFFAGLQKVLSSEAWREGSALHQVLQDVPATPFGLSLGTLPLLDCVLSYGALVAELVGPWFLIFPVARPVRAAAILYIGANLLGFAAALEVGRLPWVALAALVAHVPGSAWERLGLPASLTPAGEVSTSPSGRHSKMMDVMLVVALLHALAYNVARLRNDEAEPTWLEALAGVVVPRQGWGMFRKVGLRGVPEWFVVAGTRNGETTPSIRLPDGHPLGLELDSAASSLRGNQRWGYFWSRAEMLATDYPDVLQRYLQSECDDFRPVAPLERVEIVWVRGRRGARKHETLTAHTCSEAREPAP